MPGRKGASDTGAGGARCAVWRAGYASARAPAAQAARAFSFLLKGNKGAGTVLPVSVNTSTRGLVRRADGAVVRRLTVRLDPDVATHLFVRAASMGVPAGELVEAAIRRTYMRPPRRKKASR